MKAIEEIKAECDKDDDSNERNRIFHASRSGILDDNVL